MFSYCIMRNCAISEDLVGRAEKKREGKRANKTKAIKTVSLFWRFLTRNNASACLPILCTNDSETGETSAERTIEKWTAHHIAFGRRK